MSIKYKSQIYYLIMGTVLASVTSCNKLVEVDPPITSTVADVVYSSDATAISSVTGLYTSLSAGNIISAGTFSSLSLCAGLSADELILSSPGYSNTLNAYYTNNLSSSTSGPEFWTNLYTYVYVCNEAIENLNKATGLSQQVQQQLLGEAKFMRAFLYFYIINLYENAPLVTGIDYKQNQLLPSSSKSDIYKFIIDDLKDAQSLLSPNFLNGQLKTYTGIPERVRPTSWAATALLARVYLYVGDYSNAEIQSSQILNNTTLFGLVALKDVFTKNSKEAIWQLQPVTSGSVTNTSDAVLFIIPSTGPSQAQPVYLSNNLLVSFEAADDRKSNWISSVTVTGKTYYYPYKYKVNASAAAVTEYLMMFRFAEQYLIRSEARAQQNNVTGSQSDLNAIRKRANLSNTTANDKNTLLIAINHERQVELFTELGHRWFDLKRTNNVDALMSLVTPAKGNGATWQSYMQLYPVPLMDVQRAPNIMQNSGY